MYCNKTMVSVTARYQDCVVCIAIKQWSVLQQGIRTVLYVLQYKQWSVLQQGIRTVLYVLQ